jgi:hypothetical protein
LAEEGTDISARNQVVHELGATAARLRRKLGEPAESLARFNQPLEKATSASLEALQTGTEGTKFFLAGNPQAALPCIREQSNLTPILRSCTKQSARPTDLSAITISWQLHGPAPINCATE